MGTSKLQKAVGERLRLTVANSQVYENYRPYWMCDEKGRRLELDFYLPHHDTAIEVQGMQHYRYTPHFHPTYDDFLQMRERDLNKRQICLDLGIKLFEISSDEELEHSWPEICQALSVQPSSTQKPKNRQASIQILDEEKLKLHISRFQLAKSQENPFFVRAVYIRAKTYFTTVFNSTFVRRCSSATLQEFISLSESFRLLIKNQRSLLKNHPQNLIRKSRFRKELDRINKALSPKLKHKAYKYTTPKPYRRAKRILQLEQLPGGHFMVYGGSEPHIVTKTETGYSCNCLPSQKQDCLCCSHKYRVQIEIESRERELAIYKHKCLTDK